MTEQTSGPSAALSTEERLGGLLDAVVGLAGDLDLGSVLERIATVAGRLVGAEYAALAVLGTGPERRLREFVTHGLTDAQRAEIGDLPRGHGILGLIIDEPGPLRLEHLGDHPASFGFPPNHPPMDTFLGALIRIRDKVFGNLYLTQKRAPGGFTDQDEELLVALAAAAGVVIENARLYEESARRRRWLEAAMAITAALLAPVEQDAALRLVADRARDVAGADIAAVLLSGSADRLVVEVASGVPDDVVGTSVPIEGSLSGSVVGSGQMLVVEDPAAGLGTAWDPVLRDVKPDGGPMVLLPMRSANGVDGVLTVGWTRANAQGFHETDIQLPAAFAEQAALALQVATLRQDQALLAVVEDRHRIARDLHDLVIQRLFAVGLALENTTRLTDPPAVTARVVTAVDDIDATIKEIRRTIFELSSPQQGPQLRRRLIDVVADTTGWLGFEPEVRISGPVDTAVSPQAREHLLATLREALSNIARHAAAGAVQVAVSVGGHGAAGARRRSRLHPGERESGLRNMRTRAESLGGRFAVRSAPGRGTELTWRVPLVPADTPAADHGS